MWRWMEQLEKWMAWANLQRTWQTRCGREYSIFGGKQTLYSWQRLWLVGIDRGYIHVRYVGLSPCLNDTRICACAHLMTSKPHVQGADLSCYLCSDLNSTQVTGDVTGWSAMTQATYMCAAYALSPWLASTCRVVAHVPHVQGADLPCIAFADTCTIRK